MKALKSEFIKLLTIRSSYIMAGVTTALVAVVSIATLLQQDLMGGEITSGTLETSLFGGVSVAAQLVAVFAVILIGHEYRYNIIHHTLIVTRSRSVVLLAKIITTLCYALVVTALAAFIGYIGSIIAFNFIEESAADQVIDVGKLILHSFIYVTGFTLIGLLLGLLFRTIVAPIVILILAPGTIEPLIGLLLDGEEKYLPFTSIQSLVVPGMEVDVLRSVATISAYLVIGWAIAWYGFHHRDAS